MRPLSENTDDVTSATAGYPTSGTANAITADATAFISEANTTDTEDAPTITTAATAYPAPPTADAAPPITDTDATPPTADADATPPTADANVALPTASTASSSRGDSNTQACRVFTIPPGLPLTEDE
eukprot:g13093.t1